MQQLHDKDYGEDFFAPASLLERRREACAKARLTADLSLWTVAISQPITAADSAA
jgi:hypothetical protein